MSEVRRALFHEEPQKSFELPVNSSIVACYGCSSIHRRSNTRRAPAARAASSGRCYNRHYCDSSFSFVVLIGHFDFVMVMHRRFDSSFIFMPSFWFVTLIRRFDCVIFYFGHFCPLDF